MMTPVTTVRPFRFEIIDLSFSVILMELPERFVRCDSEGVPDTDHLYEVVETLVEARGFETALRIALIPTDCDTYYPHVVQFGAINGWVRATGGGSVVTGEGTG